MDITYTYKYKVDNINNLLKKHNILVISITNNRNYPKKKTNAKIKTEHNHSYNLIALTLRVMFIDVAIALHFVRNK